MLSLENKNVLIVGATSEIGRSTALSCARMGAGLFLSGRNEAALKAVVADVKEQCSAAEVADALCDLACDESVEAFIGRLPKLDGIVFVAGTLSTMPCKMHRKTDVEKALEVNFNAVVAMMATLMREKKVAKGASVVFVSSVMGNLLAEKGNALYGASKAALTAYSKTLALELAGRKVRVNTVMPGVVRTKFLNNVDLDEEYFKADEAKYPLGYGTPDDVAPGIVFLLSDEARWITGTSLVMDGGRTLQ